MRRRGLLLTPEEIREPPVLGAAARQADLVAGRLATFKAAVTTADDHERVVSALPPRRAVSGAKAAAEAVRIEHALREGPGALSADERFRLLSSREALARLRAEVAAHRAHPAWWQGPAPLPAVEPPRSVRDTDVQGALAEGL